MNLTDPRVRKLFSLLYLAGFLLMADQLMEALAVLLASAPSPSSVSWRFGAVGLIAGRLSVFLVGDTFLFAAAIALEHRVALRALGWAHLALATIGLMVLLVFGLDAIQIRGRTAGFHAPVNLAAFRAGLSVALAVGLMFSAGVASIHATKKPRRKGHSRETPPLLTDSERGATRP